MKFKLLPVIITSLLLGACGADDGSNGTAGTTGEQGPQGEVGATGPQGVAVAGISCWDLNENHIKDSSEDTNGDTVVDAWDCRASFTSTGILIDSSDPDLDHEWDFAGRKAYFSHGFVPPEDQIVAWSGTFEEYWASSDGAYLNSFVNEPIDDVCGVWKWTEVEGATGSYWLQADDAVAYKSMHFAAAATGVIEDNPDTPDDESGTETYYGYHSCAAACTHDAECVGATYATDIFTDTSGTILNNSLTCHLLRDVGFDIAQDTEYKFFKTGQRGNFTSGLKWNTFLNNGFISVCKNEP